MCTYVHIYIYICVNAGVDTGMCVYIYMCIYIYMLFIVSGYCIIRMYVILATSYDILLILSCVIL